MDPPRESSSPDKLSFRKLTNDAANRKYRRHSPAAGLESSSSDGSPKRQRSRSPVHSKEERSKMSDDRRSKDNEKEIDRESTRNRSSRGHESHNDRHLYGNSRESRKHDGRYHRRADEDDRGYHRFSRSGRESRIDTRSDNKRHDAISDRSRDSWRSIDDHSREKSDNMERRSKDRDREPVMQEHHKYDEKGYEKSMPGGRQMNSTRDYGKNRDRDQYRDRGAEDDKTDRYRSPGKYRNDHASSHEESRGHLKETRKSKEFDGQEDLLKRKQNDQESEKHNSRTKEGAIEKENRGLIDSHEGDGRNKYLEKSSNKNESSFSSAEKFKLTTSEGGNPIDDKPCSRSKLVKEGSERVTSETLSSTANQAGASGDVDAAKVAAMKAAELVNRNLVGVGAVGGSGYLSTDQKKKLLWGSKKNNSAEETANRWDLNLFADRERQEKFNKLMSLRLPWYLWPIVGCEGEHSSGEQACRRQCQSQEAGGARYGLRKAIHCRTAQKRRSNSWSWSLMISGFMLFNSKRTSKNTLYKFYVLYLGVGELFLGCF
ncbi:uncharacterized protein [Typha angustifolia]|uniref:uncharacterized protein isoform X1 n=1 Tax=Typha angustifolia TaxID=59011 RepID=UPI003C3076C5